MFAILDIETTGGSPASEKITEIGIFFHDGNKVVDDKQQLLYIGKSKNIRHRVLSHLGNITSKRAMEMKQRIHSIGHELTGSELIALLKESREIKDQNG